MGITELLLGKENPVSQYVGQNRQAIRGAFAGLGQGRNFSEGLGQAALGANQGAQRDDAFALTQAAEAKRQEQLMATIAEMRKYNPQIADIVATGSMDPQVGWTQIMQGMSGRAPRTGEINDKLVNLDTGEMIADFSDQGADLPSGYIPDPSVPGGMTPAPGSAEDYKRKQDAAAAAAQQQAEQRAAQAASQDAATSLKSATDAIDRAQQLVGPMTAGNVMGSEFGQSIPFLGQGAADLAAEIETIESFIGLDKLMAMKAASPTGASGLGQVTEKEMRLLVAQVASLRQTQDPVALAAKLRYIKQRLDEWGVTAPTAAPGGLSPDIEQLVQMYGG